MIKLEEAKNESRKRDKKRGRYLLTIGKRKTHLTRQELFALCDRANTLVLDYWENT